MFDDYWEHIVNGSKKELDMYQQTLFKSQNEAMKILSQAVSIIINDTVDTVTDEQLRAFIFEIYPKEMLREALLITGSALRPVRQTYLFYLNNYYANLKQFTPNLLKTIDFKIAHSKDSFQNVLQILIDIQTGKRRKLPDDAPVDFVTPSWNKLIFENDQQQPEIFPNVNLTNYARLLTYGTGSVLEMYLLISPVNTQISIRFSFQMNNGNCYDRIFAVKCRCLISPLNVSISVYKNWNRC